MEEEGGKGADGQDQAAGSDHKDKGEEGNSDVDNELY